MSTAEGELAATWPVHELSGAASDWQPAEGTGLCLSGGGSRAMLFHVGALWRLNELGLLGQLDRVSSVSGGSITAGVLGTRWAALSFDPATGAATNYEELIVRPIRQFASKNLDIRLALEGALLPGMGAADRYAGALRDHLFGDAKLSDLPADPGGPRFIFNATNLATGVLWRFSKPYAADWRVGSIPDPIFDVATAVAASGAFPPFFAPLVLKTTPTDFGSPSGANLHLPAYMEQIPLADGGIYDNLGLEAVFKRCRTVFVSDGGGRLGENPAPPTDWLRLTLRVMNVIDQQVRNLRKRLLVEAYRRGDREGAYWGIRQVMEEHPARGMLPCDPLATRRLAEMPTRLARVPAPRQRGLINWGYAIADASIRGSLEGYEDSRPNFPYPEGVT